MEEHFFRRAAVAAELMDVVEARLHTDGRKNIDAIKDLQRELTGSVANPIYVMIDPETERKLDVFEGATRDEDAFLGFLRAR